MPATADNGIVEAEAGRIVRSGPGQAGADPAEAPTGGELARAA